MDEIELKPCPFCGSVKLKIDNKQKLGEYDAISMHRLTYVTYSVRCNVCHARGGCVSGTIKFPPCEKNELKKKAAEAWNRRAELDKREKWQPFYKEYGIKYYTCSGCGLTSTRKCNYCSDCGAKMDGETDKST